MSWTRRISLALFLLVLAGPALAASKPTQGLRYPSLTPDGKQVVFGYRGDIWIAPVDGGGPARRLTLHEAQDTIPRVSPDGKQIVFSSRRNGSYDLFLVPVTGGEPKQITFHSASEIVCDWSPDGRRILFLSERAVGPGGLDLFEVAVTGGTPRRITWDGGRDGSYSPDGKLVVYARGFNDIYEDNYHGSCNYDLYITDRNGGIPRRLTHTSGNERYPFFSADGATIYYIAEEKGVANFYSMPVSGGARTQITHLEGSDAQRPDLAWDGKTAVFERVGRLYVTDLTDPKAAPKLIPLTIRSDVRNSGIERRTITEGGEQVDLDRNESRVAFALRGDIWTMPAHGGTGRRLTSGPAIDQWPRFSPDGRSLAYFSNARGNNDLYLLDLKTGAVKQLTRNPADDFYQCWAPNGRSLVFTSERSGNRDLWRLDLETGVSSQLTKNPAPDDDPAFSPDGRLIAFDSGRDGGQAIYVMKADGTDVRRVTQQAGFLQVPRFSPDGQMIVYESFVPTTGSSGGLYVIRTGGGPSVQISRDGQTACWSPSGKWIYFHANRGPHGNGVFRVPAPKSVEPGELVPFIGNVEVNRRQELADLFDEAWTRLRDGFYDPKMHGVDWNAMRKKYRDMAIDTENKAEFQNVIRQMLAELGASHLGIGGGTQEGDSVVPHPKENGLLGMELAPTPTDGGFRIVSVLPGGPADLSGLRVGDVVTRLANRRLVPPRTGRLPNLDLITAGTVGKEISVHFKPRTPSGLGLARSRSITPVSRRQLYEIRYRDWVHRNQERVKELTSGEASIGYIHLNRMDGPNLLRFQQAVQRWNSRRVKGMVLDIRNNGGGNIHGQLMQILLSRPLAYVRRRGGPKMVQPPLYWDRPVVLLINQRSFSDAEVFPYMFQAAGRGKIVGVPTAGGVIGTQDITLSDGSMFRIPSVGFWGLHGEALEGLGIRPDYLVEISAEDRRAGRDPQIDRAAQVILDLVKEDAARRKAEAEAGRKTAAKKAAAPKPPPKKPAPPKPKPAPAKPAPSTDPDRALLDARPGEWVRYRLLDIDSGAETVFRVEVEKVEEGMVRVSKTIESGGASDLLLPDEAPQKALLDLLPSYGRILSRSTTAGKLRDRAARFLVVDLEVEGIRVRLTFTNVVPAFGLLKIVCGSQVILEATDWGGKPALPAGEPATPPKREKPAPPPGAGEAEAPDHPIYDAEVGEWVKVRWTLPNGRKVPMVLEVLEVTEDSVILSRTIELRGRKARAPNLERKRDRKLVPPEGFTLVGYGRETITVKDRDLDCVVMTATDSGGTTWKWWVCPEIPVNGYVRVMKGDEVMVELMDWGKR